MALLINLHLGFRCQAIIFLFIIIGWSFSSKASHLVGGELTYNCIGNDEYVVELEIYRDCSPSSFADFDSLATLFVFDGDTNYITTLQMPLDLETQVEPVESGIEGLCLAAMPDFCIERSTGYIDTISLPANTSGYLIVYQRCCRNMAVSNILEPTAIGSTYFIKIPNAANAPCNNSPSFNALPPIVLCVNEPFEFDHSATDLDGDSLSYEFMTPFVGASTNNAIPEDPTFPPYENVVWQSGFSENYQFPSSPAMSIDAATGLLTAFPTQIGHYVVGVSVNEFRDGVLLNQHYRDYQFVITECSIVHAEIENTVIDVNGNEILNACNLEIDFLSIGNGGNEFYWTFGDITSDLDYSYYEDPTYEFPSEGQYEVSLFVSTEFCSDSTTITVNIAGLAEPQFEYTAICYSAPVEFFNTTVNPNNETLDYSWNFGDGNLSNQTNPSHTYTSPGTYAVELIATDETGCDQFYSTSINVISMPSILLEDKTYCFANQPNEIEFVLPQIDVENYDWNWTFSDGFTSNEIIPSHSFNSLGEHSVSLELSSGSVCASHSFANYTIESNPLVEAGEDFTIKVGEQISLSGYAEYDEIWMDALGNIGNVVMPIEDSFYYLQTTSDYGCSAIDSLFITVDQYYKIMVPSAFSPNNDGVNDKADIYTTGIEKVNTFSVFNRYGQKVFENNGLDAAWDGSYKGKPQELGSYIYYVEGVTFTNELVIEKGSITLIR